MPFDWKLAWEIGTRGMDAVRSYGAPYNSDEFIEAHAEALKNAVDLLPDLGSLSQPQLEEAAKDILRQVAAVVTAYHRKLDIHINANYMIPMPATADLRDQAAFTRPGRDLSSFGCFLVLKTWAHPPAGLPVTLVLPVETNPPTDETLFGAPAAFVNNRDYLVNDTLEVWPHFQDQESSKIRRDLADYFNQHRGRLRSFVSMPVRPPAAGRYGQCAKDVIGVVNVQSTATYPLGFFKGNQAKLRLVLTPLLHVLSYYLVRLYYWPDAGAGTPEPAQHV